MSLDLPMSLVISDITSSSVTVTVPEFQYMLTPPPDLIPAKLNGVVVGDAYKGAPGAGRYVYSFTYTNLSPETRYSFEITITLDRILFIGNYIYTGTATTKNDKYYFPTTDVKLSIIGIKGKQNGPPYRLSGAQGKTIYGRNDRPINIPASGPISMSRFINNTFTVPTSPAPIADQQFTGHNYDSTFIDWKIFGTSYTVNGGVRGGAGFNSAVAMVTDEEIMSLTITFFENASPAGASTFSKNYGSEVYIEVGGIKYVSSMGTHTFTNLSGTTLKILVHSTASDGGLKNATLGGDWNYILNNRVLTLVSSSSDAYNAG